MRKINAPCIIIATIIISIISSFSAYAETNSVATPENMDAAVALFVTFFAITVLTALAIFADMFLFSKEDRY